MSAAGRGPRGGGEEDFFPTPSWCVDRLLEAWQPVPGLFVEPGAGNGAIIRAFNHARGAVDRWCAIELRPEAEIEIRRATPNTPIVEIGDFLRADRAISSGVSAVIGNPPFILAEEFIRQSRRCYPNADVVFLLRVNFLGSGERVPLWPEIGLPNILILPDRPQFRLNKEGKRGSDATEYAWFQFPPNARTVGYVKVLASTPLSIRKGPA